MNIPKESYIAIENLLAAVAAPKPRLDQLLKQTGDHFGAFGCILWEAASETRLYMLGCWFPDEAGTFAIHDLPIKDTVSGTAFSKKQPYAVADVQQEGGPCRDHQFLNKNNLGPVCSVPLEFMDGRRGTLDLLRQRTQSAFTNSECSDFWDYSKLIPSAYKAVLDRRNYELVLAIDKIIQSINLDELQLEKPDCLKRICQTIGETFPAIETSLFMMNPLSDKETYELRASTWNGEFERDAYRLADARATKTGWIIQQASPILLFDLNRTDPRSAEIQDKYPELEWQRFDRFFEDVIQLLNLPDQPGVPLKQRDDLPPLSYMAAPIFRNQEVVGVIRCCGSFRNGPGFFSERDLSLLMVVAGQIARLWTTFISREESERTAETLTRLAAAVQSINSNVHNKLARNTPDPETRKQLLREVLAKSLEALGGVLPEATAIDIRTLSLKDKESGSLRFTSFHGEGWKERGIDQTDRIQTTNDFPVFLGGLPDFARSLGEKVIRAKRAFADDKKQPGNFFHLRKDIMPGCRHTYCAPIIAGERIYGVLDILTEQENAFSKQAQIAAEVVGSQLALYVSLFEKIDELQDLKRDVDDTYEDLAHQLKGPVSQTYFRASDLIDRLKSGRATREIDLYALRGLCQKSLTVMRTLSFIRGVAEVNLTGMDLERLKRLFAEAAFDYERANSSSGTTFYLDAASWSTCRVRRFSSDEKLLPQVISVVCDNAMKYSYAGTQIEVTAEAEGSQLQVTLASKGLAMSAEDVKQAKLRGWRGDKARQVTAEGRGIGLYLCDMIMTATGGELRILPTDNKGITRVRLLFKR